MSVVALGDAILAAVPRNVVPDVHEGVVGGVDPRPPWVVAVLELPNVDDRSLASRPQSYEARVTLKVAAGSQRGVLMIFDDLLAIDGVRPVAAGWSCGPLEVFNVRTFDESVRTHVLEAIERIANAEAAASGAPRPPEITPLDRYPLNVNDKAASERVAEALRRHFPADLVETVEGSPLLVAVVVDEVQLDLEPGHRVLGVETRVHQHALEDVEALVGRHLAGHSSIHLSPSTRDLKLARRWLAGQVGAGRDQRSAKAAAQRCRRILQT